MKRNTNQISNFISNNAVLIVLLIDSKIQSKIASNFGIKSNILKNPKDWKAVLTRTLQDHRTCTYNFRFIQWEDKADKVHMNVLLTAVEKLFLSLDPNVKVHVRKMNVKTTYR